jgi:ubiquinol-cytochrome c reductase cytochrome b subunit
MPFLGHWRLGHRFNLGLLVALLVGAGVLTELAVQQDQHDQQYHLAVREADRNAERVKILAQLDGIPPAGAVTLLRNDPLTQGPKLFARNCAGCHRYGGEDGTGIVPKDPPAGSDLKGFASRQWLEGLLDPNRISSTQYFGATKFKDGKMSKFVHKDLTTLSPSARQSLGKVIAAVSAEAQLKSQRTLDVRDQAIIAEGRALLASNQVQCTECHQFRKPDEDATAPDLTGYGSHDWLVAFISDPTHSRFYGKRNDRMPLFGKDQVLDAHSISLVADWLRGDWEEPEAAKLVQAGRQKE